MTTEENKGNVLNVQISVPVPEVSFTLLHEYQVLLKRAEDEIGKEEFSLSIILSHASIEICTESAFKLLFSYKKIEYLYDAIVNPSWKYNNLSKSSSRERRLYAALSGESFDTKANPLWSDLEVHFKKRHGIAHRGTQSTKQEAELSLRVAREYIKHINNTLERIKPPGWGV